jgi:hypothetical protein
MADPATRGKGAEGALLTALAGSGEKRTAQVSTYYYTIATMRSLLVACYYNTSASIHR